LEGYGVTESAPVLAINTPMFNKFGTVGRLMPGVEARLEPVAGLHECGRLFVRGPNVMLGYVRAENPGVIERSPEGWHDTGDIVTIDAKGFVTITGRARRFAKIGGEMIPLGAVETLAAELWPDALSAVTTVPGLRKGERVILFTQRAAATRSTFQSFARSKGASDLMIPSDVLVLEKIPVLGTGKLDNLTLSKLAQQQFAHKNARGERKLQRPSAGHTQAMTGLIQMPHRRVILGWGECRQGRTLWRAHPQPLFEYRGNYLGRKRTSLQPSGTNKSGV
jgi:acyl-[acyl-carrier-protein]-phospholipid O-acyltransferase / long-chain-fatty-acid--[acyl-carrier-protein] ligase